MRRRERCGNSSRASRPSAAWTSSPTSLLATGARYFDRQSETLNALESAGFKVNPHRKLVHSYRRSLEVHRQWEGKRESLPYEIDGIVIKVDRIGTAA